MIIKPYISLLVSFPLLVNAQTNYVVNTANSDLPGTDNTLVGPKAGYSLTTSYGNSYLGSNAGYSNTSGYEGTFIGYWSASRIL